MSKEYRVWIEIEEHDAETDTYEDVTGLTEMSQHASTVMCDSIAVAEAVALAMHDQGRQYEADFLTK